MRFLLSSLLILLALPVTVNAAAPAFRNFVWGVSPADVKKFESALFYDDRDGLAFFEDTSEGRVIYRYDFQGGKLWRIRVNYMDLTRPYPQEILDIVADLQARLSKKFGKPVDEKLIWSDVTYRRYAKMFPRAFYMQHVRLETEWQKEDTNVRLQAFRGNHGYELTYTLENKDAMAGEEVQPFDLFTFND